MPCGRTSTICFFLATHCNGSAKSRHNQCLYHQRGISASLPYTPLSARQRDTSLSCQAHSAVLPCSRTGKPYHPYSGNNTVSLQICVGCKVPELPSPNGQRKPDTSWLSIGLCSSLSATPYLYRYCQLSYLTGATSECPLLCILSQSSMRHGQCCHRTCGCPFSDKSVFLSYHA